MRRRRRRRRRRLGSKTFRARTHAFVSFGMTQDRVSWVREATSWLIHKRKKIPKIAEHFLNGSFRVEKMRCDVLVASLEVILRSAFTGIKTIETEHAQQIANFIIQCAIQCGLLYEWPCGSLELFRMSILQRNMRLSSNIFQ